MDLIVTPTRVIRVSGDAKKQAGVERVEKIFWNLITKEKMQSIELLKVKEKTKEALKMEENVSGFELHPGNKSI